MPMNLSTIIASGESMSLEDFVNIHFFTLMLIFILLIVFAIGIVNTQFAYLVGIVGTIILCFIDRNERNK